MHVIRWVVSALLVSLPALSQTAPPRPEFEVASIRPSGPQPPSTLGIGLHIDGAQVTFNYLALRDYIAMAYDLKNYQISGPDWLATTRFDIAGKVPAGTGRDQVRPMLRSLLEDRFQMKTHRDTKEFAVYALVVAKGGPKMKESPLDPEGGDFGTGRARQVLKRRRHQRYRPGRSRGCQRQLRPRGHPSVLRTTNSTAGNCPCASLPSGWGDSWTAPWWI